MTPDRFDDTSRLLLRVLVAGVMLFHGVDAILNPPGHVLKDLAALGFPDVLAYGVFVGEVLALTLILLGAWTRMAAMCAGSVAFATLLVQGGHLLRLEPTGGWTGALWAFYIVAPLGVSCSDRAGTRSGPPPCHGTERG